MKSSANRCAHLIYTPMTGVGLHGGYRGDRWLKHRLSIFKNYTLKSLLNQSNRDFIHWFSFRPEERDNPLVQGLDLELTRLNYPHIFTYRGLMYWDDKFTNYTTKTRLRNLLMMLWDCWIYKEWKSPLELLRNSFEDKNATLPERLTQALDEVAEAIGTDHDWVYLTRIDSDDMFHKEAVNLIQSQAPEQGKALVFDRGYILNIPTGQVAEWNPPTNPPFHTIIFPAWMFFSSEKHLAYYQDFRTHEDITHIFTCVTLDMEKYMVTYHGKHISTAWTSPVARRAYHKVKYRKAVAKGYMYTTSGRNISTHWHSRTGHVKNFMIGREFESPVKEEILKDFGL